MKMVWQVTDCVDQSADDVRGSVDFWAGDGDVIFESFAIGNPRDRCQ
jgi:hypothetical protein